MAANLATDLKPDTGRARELCLIINGGEYGGYRQDILTENLTERELCGLVVEMCKLDCGAGLTRDNLRIHMTDTCVQRLVACEHCLKDFKFCNLADHHGECPKMNIPCDLCGTIMYRENMTSHVEQYCPEKEVECLFAKYNCKFKIQRKNLTQHLDEKRTDHLELKLYAMELKLIAMEEIMMKQNETIEMQDMKISDQNQEIKEIFQQLTNLEEESNHSCMETESEDNNYSSGEDYLCDSDD